MRTDGIAAALGAFVAGLAPASGTALPDGMPATLALRVLDTIAAHLHGLAAGHGDRLLTLLDAAGPAVVWGTGATRSLRDAIAINAALSHAVYFEDGSRYTGGHPSSAVIPAAVTLAADRRADGAALLTAIAAGYEVFLRLGNALYPSTVRRGFQSTAVLAAPASAAAAAVLLGLDARAAGDAIALACSYGAGLKEALQAADSQPLQVGRSSEGGVLAARFAALGARGAPLAVEHGLLTGFADDADPAPILAGLGRDWHLGNTYVKLHGGCRGNHAPVDAAMALVERHRLAADRIERIDVAVDSVTRRAAIEPPTDAAQARFSIAFSIAVALTKGDATPPRFDAATLADAEVARLMARTEVRADPALDVGYPARRPAVVRIVTDDGRRFEQALERALGEPESPVDARHVIRKFDAVAAQRLGDAAAVALRERVLGLATLADVDALVRGLAVAPAADASGASAGRAVRARAVRT